MTPRLCTKCVFSPGLIQCGESAVGGGDRGGPGEVCAQGGQGALDL